MRRNRKSSVKKERIIMITSSAFVLAALTMTGVYMKDKNLEAKDDGYTMDFAALENSADEKFEEIAQNEQKNMEQQVAQNNTAVEGKEVTDTPVRPSYMDDDLDYMPLEVGSGLVEIPGLTDGKYTSEQEVIEDVADGEMAEADAVEAEEAEAKEPEDEVEEEEAASQNVVVSVEPHFTEAEGLLRPTVGEIMMPYSMDGSIYFATLDQYKYNPAVMFHAQQGSAVSACADGKVVNIYEDAQIGHAVTIDLGDGYLATYGQLENIEVTMDSYVEAGQTIGTVAAPTKYFSVEGSNLYFQLTKDGAAVNPESLF